jgi:hypothetical protein
MYIKKSKFNASPQDSSYVSTLSITYQSDMADFLPTTILSFFFTGNLIGQIGIRFTEQYLDSEHRLNIWLKHLEFYPIVRGINYSSLMSVLCMWDNIIERKRFRICPQIREVNSIRSDGTSPIVLRCVLFSTFVLLFLRWLFAFYLCYTYCGMYFEASTRLLMNVYYLDNHDWMPTGHASKKAIQVFGIYKD